MSPMAPVPSPCLVILLSYLLFLLSCSAIRPEQLGVKRTESFFQTPRWEGDKQIGRLHYHSVVEIAGLSTWSNEQIVHLLFQAHKGMITAHKDGYFKGAPQLKKLNRPPIMTVMVIDNTAYISSTVKGGSYLFRANGQMKNPGQDGPIWGDLNKALDFPGVQKALAECQLKALQMMGHRNGACCGEPLAALAYFTLKGGDTPLLNAKMVTSLQTSWNSEDFIIMPPCNHPSDPKQLPYQGGWGCHEYTTWVGHGVTVIDDDTQEDPIEVRDEDIRVVYAQYP